MDCWAAEVRGWIATLNVAIDQIKAACRLRAISGSPEMAPTRSDCRASALWIVLTERDGALTIQEDVFLLARDPHHRVYKSNSRYDADRNLREPTRSSE